jgi:hypothetical protein
MVTDIKMMTAGGECDTHIQVTMQKLLAEERGSVYIVV